MSVSLTWGSDASDKQTTSFTLTRDYKRFPLSFSPKADSADATLEIAGTGSGDFHIGAVSLMPADNVQGFRPDTIALLKQLHSGMWRLPGGNFLSDWDWHDAIGDIDKRRPMFDYAWNAMQVNDVGMDEFMTLLQADRCRSLRHSECGARRRSLCRRRGRVSERCGDHLLGC